MCGYIIGELARRLGNFVAQLIPDTIRGGKANKCCSLAELFSVFKGVLFEVIDLLFLKLI